MSEILAQGIVIGFICGFGAFFFGWMISKALGFFDM